MPSGNPYRGVLWEIAAELAFIALLAMVAGTGEGGAKIAIVLMVILWFIYLIIHGDQAQAVINTLGQGGHVLNPDSPLPGGGGGGVSHPS